MARRGYENTPKSLRCLGAWTDARSRSLTSRNLVPTRRTRCGRERPVCARPSGRATPPAVIGQRRYTGLVAAWGGVHHESWRPPHLHVGESASRLSRGLY